MDTETLKEIIEKTISEKNTFAAYTTVTDIGVETRSKYSNTQEAYKELIKLQYDLLAYISLYGGRK